LAGSVLSFAQLVVSSVFIEHDPSGIIANPAKLGLALLSLIFDVIFLVQKYFLFPGRSIEEGKDPDEEEQLEDEDT
jgi:cystinosin